MAARPQATAPLLDSTPSVTGETVSRVGVYRLGMIPQFCVYPLAGSSLLYGVSARQEGPGCHQMGFEERIGRPIYVAWLVSTHVGVHGLTGSIVPAKGRRIGKVWCSPTRKLPAKGRRIGKVWCSP